MEHQSSCSMPFGNPQIKAVSAVNAANSYCKNSGVDYKCRCQPIGCPVPIVVKAHSSRQMPSVPRMYPQFGRAAIQPISAKENGAGRNPYNKHDFHDFRSKASGKTSKMNVNMPSHLQSHNHPAIDEMLNKSSKDEQRPYHSKLTVTCKAPTNWLRMKWGRV